MPAAKLPKVLHARLDDLAGRARKLRVLHAAARTAFLLPATALLCILADATLQLPTVFRVCLLLGWVGLALREAWRLHRAWKQPVDWEAVASAVEQEFPRLAERLTTAVELAEHADEANGSPALIQEVILDAESRARKLELAAAFPTGPATASFISALVFLLVLLLPAVFAPRGGELLRRFFLPGYIPAKVVPYEIEVTSRETAVGKGDPVTLAAIIKPTRADAVLPTSATLVLITPGREERLPMTSEAEHVWHHRRAVADADFDFRVEAGDAVSETYHVTVVEPIRLATARVTVLPPAYVVAVRGPDAPIEGLGELHALEHSQIQYELRFEPRPMAASLEFTGEGDRETGRIPRQSYPLKIAEDGSAQITIPASQSGVLALRAEGPFGVTSKIPTQPLRVERDLPPRFARVSGLSDRARSVRPEETLAVECTVHDDVALSQLVLEWRVDDGPTRSLPLQTASLPSPQVDGQIRFPLKDHVKAGQKFECRLAATDGRDVPSRKLAPQTTYFPARDWTEYRIEPGAAPLAEQEIAQSRADIERRLQEIRKELVSESQAVNLLRRGTENRKTLETAEQERLRKARRELADTSDKLEELARDVGVVPELTPLAERMQAIAERELREADAALDRVREQSNAVGRTEQFQKAEAGLEAARQKIDELLKENERIARERLDRHKLEELAREQRALAEQARAEKGEDPAELARKQKELAEELARLMEQSEAIRKAVQEARADDARRLAKEAERLAAELRELNETIRKTEKNTIEDRLADLKARQDELARKSRELASRTDAASRAAETPPLNPEDATRAREALERAELGEAAKEQEKAARELDRLARDLEQAAAGTRDAREMARQLARVQDDLRQRLARETKDRPLEQIPAERRAALERQQEAIEKAITRLPLPAGDLAADVARQRAAADARDAREMLRKAAEQGAERKMTETRESLEKLAERLPTREQRLAGSRKELSQLRQQQDAVRQKAEAAARSVERQDPDSPETRRDVAERLADSARKQAELAERLEKLDLPGQEDRQARISRAMQRAAEDLTTGRSVDAASSQQAVRRQLDRLEQALNGQTPADEKVEELARLQRELAAEAERNAAQPDRSTELDLQRRQGEIARELEKQNLPEAATAQADAIEAARQAEQAASPPRPEELARKSRQAAEKTDQLNDRLHDRESAAEAAERLSRRQQANAAAQEQRRDAASTSEARKKAAQELEELRNLRAGADAQRAKQQAQDALQRAANAVEPANNARAQQDASNALQQFAQKLARETAKSDPPADPAEEADRLAKKQREAARQTKEALEQAGMQPGEAGQKARRETLESAARQQRELSRQAGEIPGQDSPRDLQKAQEEMNRATDRLDQSKPEEAARHQNEAADALERLARQTRERQQQRAENRHADLPSREQAEQARQLAREQRQLQDETRRTGEQLGKESAPRKDNPVESLEREQQKLAQEAAELARMQSDRQGARSEAAQKAAEAARAAQQTAGEVQKGDLGQAAQSARQSAEKMEQAAQSPGSGEQGQKQGSDLARRQQELQKKFEELARDPGAARAQQAAQQARLEQQARELSGQMERLARGEPGMEPMSQGPAGAEKGKEAAGAARQAGEKLQAARDQAERGLRGEAGLSRDQAALAMERASRQADQAAREMAGEGESGAAGSPQAGRELGQARQQMGQAGQQLGENKPGPASQAMDSAARSLQQAAGQLGQGRGQPAGNDQPGDPRDARGQGGTNPGGNIGGPGGTLDLRSFPEDIAQHSGKSWGELPGEIRTRILQQMKARYGEDYANNIRYYFEQLAERK